MTKKELIAALQPFSDDLPVWICVEDDPYYNDEIKVVTQHKEVFRTLSGERVELEVIRLHN